LDNFPVKSGMISYNIAMRVLFVACVMLLAAFALSCGQTSNETPKIAATEYLLPDCDICLDSWQAYGQTLQEETNLEVILLGKRGTPNFKVATIGAWAQENGREFEWVDAWYETLDILQAGERLGLSPPEIEDILQNRSLQAKVQKEFDQARKQNIRVAPTLVLKAGNLVILDGKWTREELMEAFKTAK
jgi:hypothetical protein